MSFYFYAVNIFKAFLSFFIEPCLRIANYNKRTKYRIQVECGKSLIDFCFSSCRVLMLGGEKVGKSSLVSQFMTSEYLHAYDTSIGEFEFPFCA